MTSNSPIENGLLQCYFTILKNELAYLYDKSDTIPEVLREANIPLQNIVLQSEARSVWSDVLDEATKQDKLFDIIKIARKKYPNRDVLRDIEASLQGLRSGSLVILITHEHIKELGILIGQLSLPAEKLKKYYYKSVPSVLSIKMNSIFLEETIILIYDLAQMPRQEGGTFPILEFAQTLASQIPSLKYNTKLKLQNWIDTISEELGVNDEINFLRKDLEKGVSTQRAVITQEARLLVKIEPSKSKKGTYLVQAWLQLEKSTGDSTLNIYNESHTYKVENLPDLINRLISESERYILGQGKQLLIELFLPFALFNHDINSWKIIVGPDPLPISTEYPIVIRSWDRVYSKDPITYKKWFNKWTQFDKVKTAMEPHFCSLEHCQTKGFSIELSDDIICLALTFALPATITSNDSIILRRIISNGMPVAFWPYSQLNEAEDVEQSFKDLHFGCDFSVLPKKIWQKRRMNFANQNHLLHRLVILWDDPTRLPPDVGVPF